MQSLSMSNSRKILYFALLVFLSKIGQARQITCKVVNSATGEGIKNASVSVVGTEKKTIANYAGYFSVDVEEEAELLVSCIGYKSIVIPVPKNSSQFKISLQQDYVYLPVIDLNGKIQYDTISNDYFTGGDRIEKAINEENAKPKIGWGKLFDALRNEITISNLFFFYEIERPYQISFSILPDGSVADSLSNNKMGRYLIDLIKQQKDWIPARQNGITMPQHFVMTFFLEIDEDLKKLKNEIDKFYDFFGGEMIYPPDSRKRGEGGMVLASMIINTDGTLSDFKIERSLGRNFDEEVIRAASKYKRMNPVILNGKPIRFKYTFPVVFKTN